MNSLVDPARQLLLDPFVLATAAASSAFVLSGAAARLAELTWGRRADRTTRSARQR